MGLGREKEENALSNNASQGFEVKQIVRMVLSGVIVLCVIGIIGGWFFSGDAEQKKLRDLPDCEGEATSKCLELRAGEFDASSRRKAKSHTFVNEDGERDRLRIKMSRSSARGLEGEQATGIYHDGDLIGIEDGEGERRWASAGWLPALWFLGVAAVLLAIAVGCGFVLVRMNRAEERDNPEAAAERKRKAEERLAKLKQKHNL